MLVFERLTMRLHIFATLSFLFVFAVSYAQAQDITIERNALLWGMPENWNADAIWVAIIEDGNGKTVAKHTKLTITEIPIGDQGMHSHELSGIEDAIFYLRGLDIKDGQEIAIPRHFTGSDSVLNVGSYHQFDTKEDERLTLGGIGSYSWNDEYSAPSLDTFQIIAHWKNAKQTLMETDSGFDDTTPFITWIGDLNQDGVPDLLLNLSTKYSATLDTLFVSGDYGNGDIYRKACVWEYFSC